MPHGNLIDVNERCPWYLLLVDIAILFEGLDPIVVGTSYGYLVLSYNLDIWLCWTFYYFSLASDSNDVVCYLMLMISLLWSLVFYWFVWLFWIAVRGSFLSTPSTGGGLSGPCGRVECAMYPIGSPAKDRVVQICASCGDSKIVPDSKPILLPCIHLFSCINPSYCIVPVYVEEHICITVSLIWCNFYYRCNHCNPWP